VCTVDPVVKRLAITLLISQVTLLAQTPTGTIVGTVTDPTGAVISSAEITIVNKGTALNRGLSTNPDGSYAAPALPVGSYEIRGVALGFSTLVRQAVVAAGSTTTVDLSLRVGEVAQQVNAATEASPQLQYDSHQVGGLISRIQIENLPLNGRNFLELAKLEPGVTNPVRASNNRIVVSALGAGIQGSPRVGYTRVSIDGASIMAISAIGAALSVSQDVVQEFQISTVNMDLSTSLTSNGSINIVTRSGGNHYHGSGFYFYRDHNLAAYPGLQRDPDNPDPFFQRQQFGYQFGGPIRKDRAFFFSSYERNDQLGVFSIQPGTAEFAALGGVFPSPTVGNQFNLRIDGRLHAKHNAFIRYTHDGNRFFGPNPDITLPSAWSRVTTWSDQSLIALTSVLSPRIVSDLRFSYFFFSAPDRSARTEDCPDCLGVGAPRIAIPDAGVAFGGQRSTSLVGRRYQLTESLAWQRGSHRLRFGFDWEHASASNQRIEQEPANITLYSPRQVRQYNQNPTVNPIPLPSSFLTLADILKLPLRSFLTSVGPGLVPQRDFLKYRLQDLFRLHASDTWRITPRLTVNYGLAWAYEPRSLNTDLTKPKLLEPILGSAGLKAPAAQIANFSPAVGFAWAVTSDGKTVIRGGAGRYFDPVTLSNSSIASERLALSPAGTGRRTNIPGSSISYQGVSLEFNQRPTPFTAANLLAILPGIRSDLMEQLNPENRDFTFRNLDLNKGGAANLSDPFFEAPYAMHFGVGVQRELAADLVVSADFAWRRFLHSLLFGIDYNRFNRQPSGPVIPRCTRTQSSDLTAVCSTGPITFDNSSGIADYHGLIVRLEKRFSRRVQFLASYALGSIKGSNGTEVPGNGFNIDNWFENYGPLPTDRRHVLNLSGSVDLPRQFQVSFSVSAYSRQPLSPYVNGVDFNGDGTLNDLLPGTTVNQFNRGLDKGELASLVTRYNQQFANTLTLGGQNAPLLALPSSLGFNDAFFTQDVRVGRTFPLHSERVRLSVFGEVFNVLNTANLVQYDGNIANPAGFAKPGARFTQVFGSGGPRAFQLGMRLNF
jgi:carboxypeptidase family protein